MVFVTSTSMDTVEQQQKHRVKPYLTISGELYFIAQHLLNDFR